MSRLARSTWIRYAFVIVAVWLGAQIIRQGAADHYDVSYPGLAVLWQPDSASALTALAQRRLLAHDNARATLLAQRALARAPLDVAALSTLGTALSQSGRLPEASAVMKLAGARGWRDVLTQFWLFREALLAARYDVGFARGDALLRRLNGPLYTPFFAVMARAARDPRAIEPLATVLGRGPAWRPPFFRYLMSDTKPESETIDLLLLHALSDQPAPPSDDEISQYLTRQVKEGKYLDAALAFRSLSPVEPRAGEYVVDGRFGSAHDIQPFGWTLSDGIGWTTFIAEAPGGHSGQALRVEYDGYSSAPPLGQLLVMPRGDYQLVGESLLETASADNRFHWVVSCVESGQVLASVRSEYAGPNRWRRFAAPLQVPDANCVAQSLELKADPGDLHEDIVVWYGDISITSKNVHQTSGCCGKALLRSED